MTLVTIPAKTITLDDLRDVQRKAYRPSEKNAVYKSGYTDGALDMFIEFEKLLRTQNPSAGSEQ